MTLLGSISRRGRLESATTPLTNTSLLSWLSGARSDAGVSVTEQRVLGLPAYYRALAITAGAMATLPLHVYKRGTKEFIASPTVLDRPNPRQTGVEFRFTLYAHAIAWGTGWATKVRDGSGQVREIWPLHPTRISHREVEPTEADPAGLVFLVRTAKGEELVRTSRDIFRLPYMSMDGVVGIRPLEIFRQSLGIAIAGDDASARFYANGSRPSGILTTDKQLDEGGTAAARLKARWKELTGGVENTGEIGVLDNGATFTPVSIPPVDAQLLESRQWTVGELARMVGTPPHLIGDVDRSTSWGAGIEQQVLGWVKFGLQTWVTGSEQRYDSELLPTPDWYTKHSLEGLLRGDTASRAAFYHASIVDGWRNRNEVRGLEDLEPVDGLDEFIVPSNMTLISVDGQMVPLSAAGASADTSGTAG